MTLPAADPQKFPTTRWSLVLRAAHTATDLRREALDAIVRQYLPPMRRWLIARRIATPQDADDLLHGFLADRVLSDDLLARAQSSRGRFRSFLLTALHNYAISRHRHASAARRHPTAGALLPLDETLDPTCNATLPPDDTFDIAWARHVLDRAVALMRDECETANRPDLWAIFDARVLTPILESRDPTDYPTLVARLNLPSAQQAANLLVTAKRMFARSLRHIVGEYEADDAAVEAEIRDLQSVLARSAPRA